MNTWVIVGGVIVALSLIFNVLRGDLSGLGVVGLLTEAASYGVVKLIPWVWAWKATILLKVVFLAAPIILIIGFLIAVLSMVIGEEKLGIIAVYLLAYAISCLVTSGILALIPSFAWQIVVVSLFVLSCIMSIIYIAVDEGSYAGDYELRSFEEGQQPWVM